MGRPKKIFNNVYEALQREKIIPTVINKAVVIAEAMQANTDSQEAESVIISASDFEPNKEPVLKPQEQSADIKVTQPAGEAERERILQLIREKHLSGLATVYADTEIKEVPVIKQSTTEVNMNQNIRNIKAALAKENKQEPPKLTIEHYKILKQCERFWIPYKLHGVLYGLNNNELDALALVMRQVFEPTYKFDFWCPYCIGEFIRDLYGYFEKWQEQQKEQVAEYETILKADQF